MNLFFKQIAAAITLAVIEFVAQGQSPSVDSFNPRLIPDPLGPTIGRALVYCAVQQPDGRIVAGGEFRGVGTVTGGLARFLPDGTPDTTFNPRVTNDVFAIAVRSNGDFLIGGDFRRVGDYYRTNIAWLRPDGTVDANFNPGVIADPLDPVGVYSLALDSSEQILAGGFFFTLGGQSRPGIGRFDSNGNLDSGFNPVANRYFKSSLAIQADGKILIAGDFSKIAGQPRSGIARLNTDGTLDPVFDPGVDTFPWTVLVQPDGKILIGGKFTTVGGQAHTNMARLEADGTVDATFNPSPGNSVYTMALQANGKILIGGSFTSVNGETRNRIARLNADGSLDSSFDASANGSVYSLSLQTDGKILVGGLFTSLNGIWRTNFCRLHATDSAIESLIISNEAITWLRGGTSPEIWRSTFDHTTDGVNWTNLGTGTRISGGWSLTGVSLSNGVVRARGFITGGRYNGSCWFVESFVRAYPMEPLVVTNANVFTNSEYEFDVTGQTNQIVVIETSTNLQDWSPVTTNVLADGVLHYSDSTETDLPQRFYRARLWP